MGFETAIITEITELLDSNLLSGFRGAPGMLEGGPKVRRLEDAFKDYFKVKYAIAFNSATSALHAACESVGRKRAGVTPFSFTASVSCVRMAGIKPVFIDIDPNTYCVDPNHYRTMDIDSIIPVHLFGGMADMDAIMGLRVPVIEDASQAIGSKYKDRFAGTIGDCGIFSFNQSKLISCGEGGMMITNDEDIAYIAKLIRNHGEAVDQAAGIIGYNYRMTEIEAVIAYNRFLGIDKEIARRQENVEYFRNALRNIDGIKPQWINPDVFYSWYVYSFEVADNRKVAKLMTERGIPLRHGYVVEPLNREYEQDCPVCEQIWGNNIIVTDVIGKAKDDMDIFIETLKGVMRDVQKDKSD
jgi:dTDP-4-amino-4,6-dideoxygalactose transaminase